MVENQNKKVLNELSEKTKVSDLAQLPNNIANSIQPVIEVGKNIDQFYIESATSNSSGVSVLFTTPADQDFYLTSVQLSYHKDGACDSTVCQFNATPKGRAQEQILKTRSLTLTAKSETAFMSFPVPILLERGSQVSITGTYTAGAMNFGGSATGFTVDTLEK